MNIAPAAVVSSARRETSAVMETVERDETRLVIGAEKEEGARAAKDSIIRATSGLRTKRKGRERMETLGRAHGRVVAAQLVQWAHAVCACCALVQGANCGQRRQDEKGHARTRRCTLRSRIIRAVRVIPPCTRILLSLTIGSRQTSVDRRGFQDSRCLSLLAILSIVSLFFLSYLF